MHVEKVAALAGKARKEAVTDAEVEEVIRSATEHFAIVKASEPRDNLRGLRGFLRMRLANLKTHGIPQPEVVQVLELAAKLTDERIASLEAKES